MDFFHTLTRVAQKNTEKNKTLFFFENNIVFLQPIFAHAAYLLAGEGGRVGDSLIEL